MRSLKIWISILLVVVFIAMGASAAKAVADPIFFFVIGQLINDGRQRPTEHFVIGLNPSYNVYTPSGDFAGCNPNADRLVASIGRGGKVAMDPGQNGKVDILGAEINSNEANFQKVGIYYEGLAKNFKEIKTEVGTNRIIKDDQPGKFILEVPTQELKQQMYNLKLTVWYTEKVPNMLLIRWGDRDVIKREETTIKIIVLDPAYMAQARSNPELQAQLANSYGLMAIPSSGASQTVVTTPSPASMTAPATMTFAESQPATTREETVATRTVIKGEIAVYGQRGNSFTVTTIEQPSGLRTQDNFTIKGSPCRVKITAEQPNTTRIAVEVKANDFCQRDEISYNRYQTSFDITPGKKYLAIGGDPQRLRGIDPSQIPPGSQIVLADRDMKVRSKSGSGRWYDGWIKKGEPLVVQKYKTVREGEYLVDYFRVRAIVRCGNDLKPIEYGVKVPMCQNRVVTQQVVRTEIREVAYVAPHDNFDKNFTREIAKPDQGSVSRETPAGLWTPSLYYSDDEFNTTVYGSSAFGGNATASSASAASASAAAGAASN